MTTTDTPAATITRAAERLRELADAIEPEVISLRGVPWHTEVDFETGRATTVLQGGSEPADYAQPVWRVAQAETPEVAQFIAAMHPGVARALAAWLDAEAAHLNTVMYPWRLVYSPALPALAVARQILGEA